MRSIHLFRSGRHSPMQGGTLEFSAADLAATAAAYDVKRWRAPLVVGHPPLNAPAYGWVDTVEAQGDDLLATPADVEPAFAELVRAKRYRNVSASLWSPRSKDNPVPGVWYLRHVGFLGAAPPALKGLREIEFAAEADDVVTIEFAAQASPWLLGSLFSDMFAMLRGLRDRLVSEAGAEEADRVIPGAMLQRLAEQAGALTAAPVEMPPPPAFAAQPTEVPVSDTDAAARLAALEQRERELAAREAQLAEQGRAARLREAASFAEGLVREARLPQGLAPRAAALLAALPDEGTVAFAAGGSTVTEAPAAALRALLAGLPKAVDFARFDQDGPGGEAPVALAEFGGMRVDPTRAEIHARALAYQAKHPGTSYEAAAIAAERSVAA